LSLSIHWLAAHYAVRLAQNHAFADGNKRTGIASALVFLSLNGSPKHPSSKDLKTLEDLVVDIAQRLRGIEELSAFLRTLSSVLAVVA